MDSILVLFYTLRRSSLFGDSKISQAVQHAFLREDLAS